MKKKGIEIFLACILALCLFPLNAHAEKAGLATFTAVRDYPGKFTDVEQGSWYERGIKNVYTYGIMDGMGNEKFDPNGLVSQVQAVAVASRVHAQYHGKQIPDVKGAWYQGYLSYAAANGLLPSDFSAAKSQGTASRAFMAYVFSRAVDVADLPQVNKAASISDMNTVSSEYAEAIRLMCTGGIMTGESESLFNPQGQSTRAQMATVIMRLIQPSERVTSDPKLDSYFLKNESSVLNKAPFFMKNKNDYLAFTFEDSESHFMNAEQYYKAYLCHDGKEETFSGKNYLNLTYADGYYYFTYEERVSDALSNHKIMRQSDKGGAPELIYQQELQKDTDIEAVLAYDGNVYFLLDIVEKIDGKYNFSAKLYRLGEGGKAELLTAINGGAGFLTAFNDQIYIGRYGLHAYNLKTKETRDISLPASDYTMSGNIIYYIDRNGSVKKTLAELPNYPKELGVQPYKDPDGAICFYDGVLYVYPSSCIYQTLYTVDENGLHELYGLGKKAIYALSFFDDGFFYDTDYLPEYFTWRGKIVTEKDGKLTYSTLYDYFK